MDALKQIKPRKSLGQPNFNSLPSRGIRRSKDLGTKSVINSDTFYQTKTLLYADHHTPVNYFPNKSFRSLNFKVYPADSMDSLNSSNDPDIVAALDQIASTMGLIDEKVQQTSDDPINYLLKTTSFSEKISIYKRNSGGFYNDDRRVQSFIQEPNKTKADQNKQIHLPVTPVLRKKESNFRKIIQRFSPKAVRRTKSTPSTLLSNSMLDATIEEERIFGGNFNKQMTAPDGTDSSISNTLSDEIKYQSIPNYISYGRSTDFATPNGHSNLLPNSTDIEHVDDRDNVLSNITKDHSSHNKQGVNCESLQNYSKEIENSPISQSNGSESNIQLACAFQKPLSSIAPSASYIHISLYAFGYGPNPSIRRSPTSTNNRIVIKDTQIDIQMPNDSGDQ